MSTAAGATAHIRNARGGQVAPAPQLHDDNSEMTAEQAEALRRAEEEGENMEADRTIGVYEEVKIKAAKITKKPWFVIDPRTSKLVPYWDGVGTVRVLTRNARAAAHRPGHWPPSAHRHVCARPATRSVARALAA